MSGGVAWTSLVLVWGTLVTVLITVSRNVDKALLGDEKQEFADWLETNLSYDLNWYKNTNKHFEDIFNKIYQFHGTSLEQRFLIAILFIYPLLLIINILNFGGVDLGGGVDPGGGVNLPRRTLFRAGIVTFFITIVFFWAFDWLVEHLFTALGGFKKKVLHFFSIRDKSAKISGKTSGFKSAGKITNATFNIIEVFVILIMALFSIIMTILYFGALYVFIILIYFDITNRIIAIVGFFGFLILSFAVMFTLIEIYNTLSHWLKSHNSVLVSPTRAILSSLLFMSLISVIAVNARNDFVDAINTTGLFALFLAFNVSADTISLMETRWILRKSRSVSVRQLPFLLAADLILSFLIYLILPVLVGQDLIEFWKAIRFSGPKPWIGILFWTTFSTSAIFYIFVASVVVIQLQEPITQPFMNVIDVEEHPTFTVAIVISLLLTIIFLFIFLARYIPA